MRSRISGRLLPAALAAAAATAIAAPTTAQAAQAAQAAPPPAEETYEATYSDEECAEALKILSSFELLPDQPDIARALCSMNAAKQQDGIQQGEIQGDEAQQGEAQQEQTTEELNSTYTTDTGQAVKENKLLGIPVEWPKSLTIHVPTVNDQWHSYTATQN